MEFNVLTFKCGVPYSIPINDLKNVLSEIKEIHEIPYNYLVTSSGKTVICFPKEGISNEKLEESRKKVQKLYEESISLI